MRRSSRVALTIALVLAAMTAGTKARCDRPPPAVYVIMPAAPEAAPAIEPAPPPPEYQDPHGLKLHDGAFEMTLGTLSFQQKLKGVAFGGEGTPIDGNQRVRFRHTGRELGLDSPSFWGGELQVHYVRRYFAVGVHGYMVGHPGGADATPAPPNNEAATQVNTSSIIGYGGGIDIAGAIPLSEYVALRPGIQAGARGFTLPLSGFQKTTCHSKRGTYPCDELAATDPLLVVEPRLTLQLSPTPHGELFFGGYIGMNVVDASPTFGFFLGLHTPHSALLP